MHNKSQAHKSAQKQTVDYNQPVLPPFEYKRFVKTAVITFIIGLIIFICLFFYIATH